MRVLIVEDQPRTAQELHTGLRTARLESRVAPSAEAALQLLETESFDALVVDVMLPGLSGLDLVKRLRAGGQTVPAIFLSARGTLEDRLKGLEVGGDDYLPKPYSILEVVARLKTILRRTQPAAPPHLMSVADLTWDPRQRHIERSSVRIDLTPKEYAIMTLLLEHVGEVVTRNQIVQTAWGMEGGVDPNAVDVQILRLRRKVDEPFPVKLIHTLRGVGLRLEPHGGA